MEVYLNELSVLPKVDTKEHAKQRIIELLHIIKALKKHNFSVLRTYEDFFIEDLGAGYSLESFCSDESVDRTMKNLILSEIKSPVILDEDSLEAEMFIENRFEVADHLGAYSSTEGVAYSHINNVPVVSLSGHSFWKQESIALNVYDQDKINNGTTELVVNLFELDSFQSSAFSNWEKSLEPLIELSSKTNILKVFPEDQYCFDPRAISDIIEWYYDDKRYQNRIKELLEDISDNPFKGGKGKTEVLKESDGKASKRIVGRDRIIYKYTQEKIFIYQCKGHYNDT